MGWQKQTSRRQRKRASCRNPSLFAVEMRFYSCFMVVLPKKNGDEMTFMPSYYSKLTGQYCVIVPFDFVMDM